MTPAIHPIRVLTVCTANICRSPVAERVFQRAFDRAGIPAIVRSAGTHGGELAITSEVIDAAQRIGIDVTNHQSRLLTTAMVRSADLIVTMTREHLMAVLELDLDAWPAAYTLRELDRRSADLPPRSVDLDGWLHHLMAGRQTSDLLGTDHDDDIIDPFGGPFRGYVEMVHEVERLANIRPLRRPPTDA